MAISVNSFHSNGIVRAIFGSKTFYEDEVREERQVVWLRFATQDKLNVFTLRCENLAPYFKSHPDEIRQNILAVVGMPENSRQSLVNIVSSALHAQR